VQVAQIAKEAGLSKLATVAVDGSKIRASASQHKAMSYVRMLGTREPERAPVSVPRNRRQLPTNPKHSAPSPLPRQLACPVLLPTRSAICVHPDARGLGLADELTRQICHDALQRHEVPFLHVLEENQPAIALYLKLGFRVHQKIDVVGYQRREMPA